MNLKKKIHKKKRCRMVLIIFIILVAISMVILFKKVVSNKEELVFTDDIAFYVNKEDSISVGEYILYAASIVQDTEDAYGEDIWYEIVKLDSGEDFTFEEYTRQQIVEQIRMTRLLSLSADKYKQELSKEELVIISSDAEDYLKDISSINVGDAGIDLSLVLKVYTENALAEKVYQHIMNSVKVVEGMDEHAVKHLKEEALENEYSVLCKELSPGWSYHKFANLKVLTDISLESVG